jgi:hypothetical protein
MKFILTYTITEVRQVEVEADDIISAQKDLADHSRSPHDFLGWQLVDVRQSYCVKSDHDLTAGMGAVR